MTNRKIFAATILAAAGVASGAWAAEPAASKAAPASTSAATSASAPKTCTGVWDFIETDCQLTWYGITLYGVIDAGVHLPDSRRAVRSEKPSGFRIHRPEI